MSNPEPDQVRCLRCHRVLTAPRSVSLAYGRTCQARIRAAALAEAVKDFTEAQIFKALELIADRGIVSTSRPGVYQAVSSDGTTVYLVHYAGCTCMAGIHHRLCFHRAAVRMLAVARKAA